MNLLWVCTMVALATWIISLLALVATSTFAEECNLIYLLGAPKATRDLHKVFIPPMQRMQTFVFLYDTMCLIYYILQMPMWDKIKAKFPYFQYETKPEKPDFSSYLLHLMLVLLSKVRNMLTW